MSEFGLELEIVNDDKLEYCSEILVGKTRHTTVSADVNSFTVCCEPRKLQFVANDMLGYEAMYHYLINVFCEKMRMESGIANRFSYTNAYPLNAVDGTELGVKSYGDVRVMIYNCYGYGGKAGEPCVRQPLQKEMIRTYAPTVIGLQETKPAYLAGMNPIMKDLGYAWVDTEAKEANCTSMYYREDITVCVESGYHLFTGPNNSNTKSVTWGVFKDKRINKLFAAMSTHFMWGDPAYSKEIIAQTRISNANEYVAVKDMILKKYPNIPIIGGGDMNCGISGTPHKILKDSGLLYAWDVADSKNDFSSHLGYACYDPLHEVYTEWNKVQNQPYLQSLDHVYVTPNTNVKAFYTASNLYCRWTSDHMPLLVDVDLEG
ncbi:MAG: hypothetical protein IKC59_08610 [Clostridia bacterium]|nr:hypothetical protein [Clostridia bacterium]